MQQLTRHALGAARVRRGTDRQLARPPSHPVFEATPHGCTLPRARWIRESQVMLVRVRCHAPPSAVSVAVHKQSPSTHTDMSMHEHA